MAKTLEKREKKVSRKNSNTNIFSSLINRITGVYSRFGDFFKSLNINDERKSGYEPKK